MRGPEDEELEAEPQLESSDSEEELEPEPELLPDSDSNDELEPEPELLPDCRQPCTIFDQSDEDWIATTQRVGARSTSPNDCPSVSSSTQWWREEARDDIAARLKIGAPPLPTGLQGEEGRDADESATYAASGSSASDGEPCASGTDHDEWQVCEKQRQWQEEQQLSDDAFERNEEAERRERERDLQDMRSEFSDLQDLVKRMRSPVEPAAGSTSGVRQHALRTRSVQEIESQIEASVDLSPPTKSPAGREAEVAGWLVTRRLARAEELIGQLEGVTVDDKSADIVASPFKVNTRAGTSMVTGSTTTRSTSLRSGSASRRRPRRSPGSTGPGEPRAGMPGDVGHRRVGGSVRKMTLQASPGRDNGKNERTQHKPSALTTRSQPNPLAAVQTPRRSAQRPGARASGRGSSRAKSDTLASANKKAGTSAALVPRDKRNRSRSGS